MFLQALEYVFKFIVKSRILHESLQGRVSNEFQEKMRGLFSQLVLLMEDEKNETLLIQVQCLPRIIILIDHPCHTALCCQRNSRIAQPQPV